MDKKFIIIIIISVLILFYFKKNVENMNKDTYDFNKEHNIDWGKTITNTDSTPTSTTNTQETKPLKKYLESLKKIDSFIQFYYNNESSGNAKEGLKINGYKLKVKNLKADNIEKCYNLQFKENLDVDHAILDELYPRIKIDGSHIAFNVNGNHYGFHKNGNFYHFKNGDKDYRQLNAQQGIDTNFGDDYITTDSKFKLKAVSGWYCDPKKSTSYGLSKASCSACKHGGCANNWKKARQARLCLFTYDGKKYNFGSYYCDAKKYLGDTGNNYKFQFEV